MLRTRISLLATLAACVGALVVPAYAAAQDIVPCVEAGPVAVGDCPDPPAPKPKQEPDKPASTRNPCEDKRLMPKAGNLDRVRAATLCLLNKERTKRGLRKLRDNETLGRVATKYTRLMVREGFFDHVSPGGSTMTDRVKRTSYLDGARSWALGENIAWGTGGYATPGEAVDGWMHSAGHRANILDRGYTEIGIGVAVGAPARVSAARPAATYATEFGRRS